LFITTSSDLFQKHANRAWLNSMVQSELG